VEFLAVRKPLGRSERMITIHTTTNDSSEYQIQSGLRLLSKCSKDIACSDETVGNKLHNDPNVTRLGV